MDQGNTDPNNQNSSNPIPASSPGDIPPSPSVPSSFGIDSTPVPSTPMLSGLDQSVGTFGSEPAAPVPEQPVSSFTVTPTPTTPVIDSTDPVSSSNWANPTAVQTPVSPSTPLPQPETNPFANISPSSADQNQGSSPTPFNPFSTPVTETANQPLSATPETVPTDLSSLANTSSETTSYIPQTEAVSSIGTTQPDSLVVTPSVSGEASQAVSVAGGTGGFPKIFIVIGGIILLVVIAASAYFILGIGKPSTSIPESIPAEQATPTPTAEVVSPTPSPSTSSASFSNLPGTTITPTATTGGSGSAYDILLRGRGSTASATPNP